MKAKLLMASTVTLGILASFVFFIFYLIAFYTDAVNISLLITLTVITNFILWLISPAITDWMQKFFYKVTWLSFEEFTAQNKPVADFIKEVCSKHNIKIPRLRIIEDMNPTAYCYGSYPNNSRLVVSRGIFKYLDVEEQKAVVGHELGHIINKDFIIMTIAVTLVQVLYEVYFYLARVRKSRSSSKKGSSLVVIGLLSYVFYIIGTYLILYLSRTREYLADRFAAEETGNPDALSVALVKIAYGIAAEANSETADRLLASTRAMGIYDYKSANAVGGSYKVAGKDITKVFLFDLFSPWAFFAEINSTHPLTGKRIKALCKYAVVLGKPSIFDFKAVAEQGKLLDKQRLYGEFYEGMVIYSLPALAIIFGLVNTLINPARYPLLIGLLGTALVAQGLYKFQRKGGQPEKITVFELMQDPYANPLRGRFVELEGKVIGKADAGSYFGEDVKMQDKSGCLINLNYESPIPILGNMIFGLRQASKMIGKAGKAVGWFRRSSYQIVDLESVEIEGSLIKSYTRFWALIVGSVMLAVGLFLLII
ncbi:M48 family metalloprotease [Candidatus Margulisiibacteriota bacterium]